MKHFILSDYGMDISLAGFFPFGIEDWKPFLIKKNEKGHG
jgi:hypothetical protein